MNTFLLRNLGTEWMDTWVCNITYSPFAEVLLMNSPSTSYDRTPGRGIVGSGKTSHRQSFCEWRVGQININQIYLKSKSNQKLSMNKSYLNTIVIEISYKTSAFNREKSSSRGIGENAKHNIRVEPLGKPYEL